MSMSKTSSSCSCLRVILGNFQVWICGCIQHSILLTYDSVLLKYSISIIKISIESSSLLSSSPPSPPLPSLLPSSSSADENDDQARTSYLPHEIQWGQRFEQMLIYRRDQNKFQVLFSQAMMIKDLLIGTMFKCLECLTC